MQNYLPSKQFQARVILIVIFVLGFLFVRFIYDFVKTKLAERKIIKVQSGVVVKDIIGKDSNSNGIPDWEETLWGKDPNKNGKENKEYIDAKKAELAKNDENVINNSNELDLETKTNEESDQLSKELFATIASLQQEGSLNQNSIDSISEAIGQKIIPEDIPDVYTTESLINKTEPSTEKISAYYLAIKNLVEKYSTKDVGNELIFISQGIKNTDIKSLEIATEIAQSYKNFAKELLDIPTPTTISPNAIKLANSYVKTGQSIEQFSKMLTDPVTGMQGLVNYKKESGILLENLKNL